MYSDWNKIAARVDRLRKEGISVHNACNLLEIGYGSYWNWSKRAKRLKAALARQKNKKRKH